jgi:hypothetical protein
LAILQPVHGGAAKLSPAIDAASLDGRGEIEWISTGDGLKETVLWTGVLARGTRTATLLHRGVTLSDNDLPAEEPEAGKPGSFLYEPDPALIRSGLLGRKAASLGMRLLDRKIAYVSADEYLDDPCFTCYRVMDSLPFNLKQLRGRLRDLDAGEVIVKKRGFPLLPEDIIKKLDRSGSNRITVILTRFGEGHHAFIVEPVR